MATAPAGWTGPGGTDDMWTGCVGPEQGLRTPSVGVWQDRRRAVVGESAAAACCRKPRPSCRAGKALGLPVAAR